MAKQLYNMATEKPEKMDTEHMIQLSNVNLSPYIQIATNLCKKSRRAGGNMFRHQMDTLGILIDYGYIDSILLKASIIHDVIEDVPGFDPELIKNADEEGPQVLEVVKEVTKAQGQDKSEYLKGIVANGSYRAKILKCADRISNMTDLGFVTAPEFVERISEETEFFILPLAIEVDYNMYQELIGLIKSRRNFLEQIGYYEKKNS